MQKHPFLIEIEESLDRELTPVEALGALAGLYLKQRDELRAACEEAREWLQHHGGDALPAGEPGLAQLIANLETAIEKAQ